MRYSVKSLALFWLITLALFALSGSGVVTGSWLLLLLAVAFAVPVLILESRDAPASVVRPGAGTRATRLVREPSDARWS